MCAIFGDLLCCIRFYIKSLMASLSESPFGTISADIYQCASSSSILVFQKIFQCDLATIFRLKLVQLHMYFKNQYCPGVGRGAEEPCSEHRATEQGIIQAPPTTPPPPTLQHLSLRLCVCERELACRGVCVFWLGGASESAVK